LKDSEELTNMGGRGKKVKMQNDVLKKYNARTAIGAVPPSEASNACSIPDRKKKNLELYWDP